jgi:hypothetical protein
MSGKSAMLMLYFSKECIFVTKGVEMFGSTATGQSTSVVLPDVGQSDANPVIPAPIGDTVNAVQDAIAGINAFPTPTEAPSVAPTTAPPISTDSATRTHDPLQAILSSTSATTTPEPQVHMPAADDTLLSIKQEALTALTPLVNHLEQKPDERFKTLMMLIQASDDRSLVKSAYDAAKEITDEKARAQALLDVVNEINYFTAPQQ